VTCKETPSKKGEKIPKNSTFLGFFLFFCKFPSDFTSENTPQILTSQIHSFLKPFVQAAFLAFLIF